MGSLIARHGGVPCAAPVLQEIYATDTPEVVELIDDLCSGRIEIAILQTGAGTRALFEAADARGRLPEVLSALDRMTVLARSPKPAAVLRRHKVRIDLMPPEPFTSEDMVESFKDIGFTGREVAVQGLRRPQQPAAPDASGMGRERPGDFPLHLGGARRRSSGAGNGRPAGGGGDRGSGVHQPAASRQPSGNRGGGRERGVAACQPGLGFGGRRLGRGRYAAAACGNLGFSIDVEPDHPHMGNLVIAIAEYLQDRPAAGNPLGATRE